MKGSGTTHAHTQKASREKKRQQDKAISMPAFNKSDNNMNSS